MKVNLIENLTNDDFYNDTSEKMRKDIQESLDHGFKFSDITILCREILISSVILKNWET